MRKQLLLTTSRAAELLGVSVRRVQALIRRKRLPAERLGRDWLIHPDDLALIRDRKNGRPENNPGKSKKST